MADGTNKDLKDIRIGDLVATYKNGHLGISKVENWINNGLSKVFTIKTTSGIVVKANERHPFLINEEGVIKWKRVKDLRPGHEIYRVNGANGKAKLVKRKDAINQSDVEDTATITIMQNDGLMAFVRHLLVLYRALVINLNIVTASHWNNIIKCILSKMDVVKSASAMLLWRITRLVGGKYYASITATTPNKSEDSYVTTAISSLSDSLLLRCSKKQSNISDFILEKIESITHTGIEDVFDVQIAETENFIANGLVSHNTRWHEDDLIGYLTREKAADGWFHIRIPALAEDWNGEEDVLGRAVGEALCPQRYDEVALNRIKTSLTPMMWNALFQQRPAPMEGTIFLRKAWKFYRVPPVCNFILQSWDTASKKNIKSAYSVCHTYGVSQQGAVLLDRWRERVEYPQLRLQAEIQFNKWRPNVVLIEDRDTGQALIQALQQETMIPILPVYPDLDKLIRATAVSPMQESGRVWLPDPTLPENAWVGDLIDTAATFPNALYKDDIDAMSQALTYIMTMAMGGRVMSFEKRRTGKLLESFRRLM
ncbi:MAG: phage terminase large subunit [Clostridiaceae bacterium]